MKYQADLDKGISLKRKNRKLLEKLKLDKPGNLDQKFHFAHEEVFGEIECLECANCCKTTSPIFINADIQRLARHLKISERAFTERYLIVDTDNDYVLSSSPCPFLLPDNKCEVYSVRPRACREYPHTDRKRMHQITDLTLKNSQICPAVVRILDKIREIT